MAENKLDLMVDVEAWSFRGNSGLMSIAAAMFDPLDAKREIVHTFNVNVDAFDMREYGVFDIDKSTMGFWKKNAEAFKMNTKNAIPLKDALEQFVDFVKQHRPKRNWCHGMNYDFPVLDFAFDTCDVPRPWKFWTYRDTKTLFDLADVNFKLFPRDGTYHNALGDVYTQINAVQSAMADNFDLECLHQQPEPSE